MVSNIFDVDFFKVFIEFVSILLLFYALISLAANKWELSSLTKDQTCTPGLGRGSVNHWTTREVPIVVNLMYESQNQSKCTAVEMTLLEIRNVCVNSFLYLAVPP